MALTLTSIKNDANDIAGARAFVAINYGSGNQTVTSATSSAYTSCRGILVTVAGDFELIPIGMTTAVTLALSKGWHPIPLTQINQAGSTGSGFYYW